MPLLARAIMAGMAVFLVWTMVRGLRTGVLYDNGWSFDENLNPFMFALSLFSRGVCVIYCLWLAAGLSSESFLRLLGIAQFAHWLT